jgi:hypothetical protein
MTAGAARPAAHHTWERERVVPGSVTFSFSFFKGLALGICIWAWPKSHVRACRFFEYYFFLLFSFFIFSIENLVII